MHFYIHMLVGLEFTVTHIWKRGSIIHPPCGDEAPAGEDGAPAEDEEEEAGLVQGFKQ